MKQDVTKSVLQEAQNVMTSKPLTEANTKWDTKWDSLDDEWKKKVGEALKAFGRKPESFGKEYKDSILPEKKWLQLDRDGKGQGLTVNELKAFGKLSWIDTLSLGQTPPAFTIRSK